MRRSIVAVTLAAGLAVPQVAAAKQHKDAFEASGQRVRLTKAERDRLQAAARPGTDVQMEDRLGVPSTLWAADTRPAGGSAASAARVHLKRLAAIYRLDGDDVDGARVASVHDTGDGAVIVKLRQAVDGVPVFRAEANVLMTADHSLVGISGYLPPADGDPRFALSADEAAVRAGLDHVISTKRVMYQLPDRLVAAYYVETAAGEAHVLAADDARVLHQSDLVADAHGPAPFSYRVWADPRTGLPLDGPQGDAASPHPTGEPDGFEPPFTAPALVTLASGPIRTRDPWLPAGATQTTGNNADAYADLTAPDGFSDGDLRAATTGANAFDRTYDLTAGPRASADQTQAAVTQAFYTVNYLHDWFYDAGFDEQAGNAQADNYGRGGVAGDPIRVEVEDYAARSNANMSTFADGTSPRMQVFPWTVSKSKLVVNAPTSVAGRYPVGTAVFGPQSFNLTGELVLVDDGAGATSDACQTPFVNAAAVSGHIAVVDRGTCGFTIKAANAQANGAVGVLVVNNVVATTGMAGVDPSVTIPALQVNKTDGDRFKAALAQGAVNVTFDRLTGPDRSGALDAQLVAHEWGHYLTNRLVGNASGLGTKMAGALGEGWGDFVALMLTVRPEDASTGYAGAYPITVYAFGGLEDDAAYFGIRRVPYSTDFAKDALTFRHIADGEPLPAVPTNAFGPNSEVHNSGEVWATMLWECYAALLRDGRLSFEQAQRRMSRYLVESLQLTPSDPTLLEARDAVLMAAYARDKRDFRLFWEAFARRGAGTGAVAPDRYSQTNVGVTESFVAGASLAYVSAALTDDDRSCDRGDGFLDGGERGRLVVALRNDGARELRRTTATVTASDPAVEILDDRIKFAPSKPGATTEASVRVRLAKGTTGPRTVTFTIAYGDSDIGPTAQTARYVTRTGVAFARDAAATDDVEAPVSAWTADQPWARVITDDPFNTVWHAPDRGGVSDSSLVSPPLVVGSGPFSLSFRHRYSFEPLFDGGVVELTTDGGTTWTDIGTGSTGVLRDDSDGPLAGRNAYTGASPGYPELTTRTLDLGTAYAGQTVRVRFRAGTDANTGAPGWDVDDIAVTGLTNTPFTTLTADGGCS